ncbi:MAG: F0F1 ATP synthase subunit alpha [bacterium]|jgi:F-type H+-transporting ATPase subunit alpha
MKNIKAERVLVHIAPPYDEQTVARLRASFEKQLGSPVEMKIVEDPSLINGFVAYAGGMVYDRSAKNRLQAMQEFLLDSAGQTERLKTLTFDPGRVGAFLRDKIAAFEFEDKAFPTGIVLSSGDEVVQIEGLRDCGYGEVISFENNVYGLALDLREDNVGAVLLNRGEVSPGMLVRNTGHIANIQVGDALLGRVVDPVGMPLDGRKLATGEYRPLESPAPALVERSQVKRPLETGVLVVDSMIPIGRGQRELIIGDRQTGKTSLALSAILNQKGKNVVCVYCAIGQKAATVARLVHTLRQAGAMEYTCVVASTASDFTAVQYLAPFAACAVAEHFMREGRDTLVVYDDLSKHAAAYRAISLLLRRPSGREAYPGDIFYLHSRLLERSAQLSPACGGGSMTALPIVETMADNISAYIPTNLISITDGQIYLSTDLFNAGIRPAVNVGLSVSRIGGVAQQKALRKVSSMLRLVMAQHRDMAAFSQFGADVDAHTAAQLHKGNILIELMKQGLDERFTLAQETLILAAYGHGMFAKANLTDITDWRKRLLEYAENACATAIRGINTTGDLPNETLRSLTATLDKFIYPEG